MASRAWALMARCRRRSSGNAGSGGLSITRDSRPYFDAATHLVIQAAQDFSDAIIDTENVEADRAKVIRLYGAGLDTLSWHWIRR